MKITKRIIISLIALALVFGGIGFIAPNYTNAEETETVEELDFAITSPTSGSLKAAGLIDIKWEDASNIGEVDSYDLFIDGSLVKNTTERYYEFYTTKVNYHRVWIRANFKDGTNHYTESVVFGVTKKGICLDDSMGVNVIKTKEMGTAWYYNWGRGTYAYKDNFKDLEYVPMVWGDKNANTIRSKVQNAINAGSKYILGFNEPDLKGQAEIPVNDVIDLWPNFTMYKDRIKIGSPAYASWGAKSEMVQFMAGVENNVDFVCLHCYPYNWNGTKEMANWMLREVVDDAYNRYHKPIWITEYSTSGDPGHITDANTAEFVKYFLMGLDQRDYVERHSFFSFRIFNQGGKLYDYSTGELTESGKAYAQNGNPVTEYKTGKEVNPRDPVIPTTAKPTTKRPTTAPKKPGKVKISKAKYKKKRKIYLKFKKVSGAKGYQVRYSDSKKFDGYWQKNTKKTKITLKKLDKNTKYYIKIRAYKLFNKAKIYGNWSKKKKVKVKK